MHRMPSVADELIAVLEINRSDPRLPRLTHHQIKSLMVEMQLDQTGVPNPIPRARLPDVVPMIQSGEAARSKEDLVEGKVVVDVRLQRVIC